MSQLSAGWLSCRQVLNIMMILGFMLNYALRVNLTIAIVEMIKPNVTVAVANGNSSYIPETTLLPEVSTSNGESEEDYSKRFDWDEAQKQLILGSFFWGYVLTELPGGRLAELVGGHRVFGHSMFWASIITLLTPITAHMGYQAMVILRALLGFMLGASWPSIVPMASVWVKPMDRSKFMSNMMASALGAAITMPICGYFISWFGWESVFYLTGGIGVFWSICWFLLIFETPARHPRITPEERKEIEDAIGSTTSKTKPAYVPWKDILTAPCVWAIILVHGASVFGYFLVVNQLPGYMKSILHYDIKANGLLSSLPYFGKYAMSVVASHFADYLRTRGKITTTVARKSFTAFAVGTPSFFFFLLIFFGHSRVWAITIFTIALTLNGAVTAGYLGNGLDIAPNFSGTIFGMANTLSSFGGFVSAWMVGVLTYNNNTYGQWQIIFAIVSVTYLVGCLSFVTMGKGELQPWNNPPEKNGVPLQEIRSTEEGVPLQTNNTQK
ncbi:sialin [Chironomus tepperi]|uniref:sialin n=1 Tax=Chironomus tepperi TaxID=113505 RepID=UPI00391F63C4